MFFSKWTITMLNSESVGRSCFWSSINQRAMVFIAILNNQRKRRSGICILNQCFKGRLSVCYTMTRLYVRGLKIISVLSWCKMVCNVKEPPVRCKWKYVTTLFLAYRILLFQRSLVLNTMYYYLPSGCSLFWVCTFHEQYAW